MRAWQYYAAKALARVLECFEKTPTNRPIRRVLLINTFGVGDVLLSTPSISAFRNLFRDAHLSFLAREDTADVLRGNPYLDEVLTCRYSFWRPARDYDLAILLTYHPIQTLSVRGVPYKVGYVHGHQVHSNALPIRPVTWCGDHLVNLSNNVAQALGHDKSMYKPQIFPEERNRETVKCLVPDSPYLVVNLKTKVAAKSWPLERMKEVIEWSPVPVILIGGNADRSAANDVESSVPSVLNLTGRLSLRETAVVLEKCSAFLTADSGPMHLGFAAGAPTVAIFGYTDPEQIFLPSEERCLLYHQRPCAPHFRVGSKDECYEECETGECMKAVGVEEVKHAIMQLLKRDTSLCVPTT